MVRDGSQLLDSKRYKDLKRQIFQCIQQENFTGYWICRGLSPEPINHVDADIFLLYVHGGGYVMGHPAENAPELLFMAELLAEKGLETAIFSLNYSLMPNAYFPTQIDQLFAAYEWIVHTTGVDPSKIIIMGESAGAHLVLSFLTFLSEMRGSASLSKPGAAFLLSPWANLRSDHPETLALHWEDRLFKQSLDVSARDFLRNATSDQLDLYENFATNNDTKRRPWDQILPKITLVSAGSDELVFLHDIRDFVKNAQKDGAEVSITIKDGVDHAWQSNEARGFRQQFLGQSRRSLDESIMPGYRKIAEDISSIFTPCGK
ncbi:alpha/beta hydrolase fold protein [Penicillium sp. IBT 35674x]|nr:alpha/beta hydrolase fold protein [Penicillium sp. IBT 35674x]